MKKKREQIKTGKGGKGGWYLIYTYGTKFTSLDTGSGQGKCEILLKVTDVTNAEEAIKEARKKWKKILKERMAHWKKQIKESTYPATTAFGGIWPEVTVGYLIKKLEGFKVI